MLKMAALVAILAMFGCQAHEFDGDTPQPDIAEPSPANEPLPVAEPVPAPVAPPPAAEPPPAPAFVQLLLLGPVGYDVSALTDIQREVVAQVAQIINENVGFEAVTVADHGYPFGVVQIDLAGCELAEGKAGFASWNHRVPRSFMCIGWSDDRHYVRATIAHEMLHTLGLPHDEGDATSIMYTAANIRGEIKKHHIAHVRKLAGLE